MMIVLLLLLLLLLSPMPAGAQDEVEARHEGRGPLVTDRPDVAESALVVGPRTVQLETGVTFLREGGGDQVAFPTLVRIGVSPRWELRLESDMVALRNPGLNSFSDFSMGAKVNLLEGEETAVGLLMNLNVPVGPEDFRGTVDPSVAVLWDQSLVGELGLGFNAGVALTGNSGDRFRQFFWAGALSHPISDRLTAYAEYFGEGPDVAGGNFQTAMDGGLLYLIDNDTQLDVAYARGLTGGGLDWSIGLGFSRRF